MWFAEIAVKSGTLQKNRIPDMAIFARNVHISVVWRGGKKMDKLIITLLVVIGVLVLFLGITLEEIKALQQDKRDWKNRYYAAAQIKAKDRI